MHDYEEEIFIGRLKTVPNLHYTLNGKAICKAMFETTEEDLRLIAWEELAIELSKLPKLKVIEISGYRKFNTYLQKEEFVIKEITKGVDDELSRIE